MSVSFEAFKKAELGVARLPAPRGCRALAIDMRGMLSEGGFSPFYAQLPGHSRPWESASA